MAGADELVRTAVPGLDTALGGGLLPGSLVIIVGPPGAGKTVLASHMLFAAARGGARALLLSTFSEGHEKLMAHLQRFAFFDGDTLASQFTLLPLPSVIGDDLEGAGRAVTRAIREAGATVVLIDGFQAMAGILGDLTGVRRFLASISTLAAYLGVTLLLTVEGRGRDPVIAPQLTTADVVLSLEYTVEAGRHRRRLDVLKQRGLAPLPGLHTYAITSAGVAVYPRLESLPVAAAEPVTAPPAAFGQPELDNLLGGGLTPGTTTVLAGAPGVGKTLLGLMWAWAGAGQGEESVVVGFGEQPERLRAKAAAFGLDLDPLLAAGALQLLRLSPVDIEPDIVADQILTALRPTTRRLVVDDVASLLAELGPRARTYLAALKEQSASRGVTTLYLHEIAPFAGFRLDLGGTPLTLLADNVVMVQEQMVGEALHRVLAVLKMRSTTYDRTLRELVLAPAGIRVPTLAEAGGMVADEAEGPA